jgi:hypothetical protein
MCRGNEWRSFAGKAPSGDCSSKIAEDSVTSGFYPGHVGLGLCLGAAHRFIVYGS